MPPGRIGCGAYGWSVAGAGAGTACGAGSGGSERQPEQGAFHSGSTVWGTRDSAATDILTSAGDSMGSGPWATALKHRMRPISSSRRSPMYLAGHEAESREVPDPRAQPVGHPRRGAARGAVRVLDRVQSHRHRRWRPRSPAGLARASPARRRTSTTASSDGYLLLPEALGLVAAAMSRRRETKFAEPVRIGEPFRRSGPRESGRQGRGRRSDRARPRSPAASRCSTK